MCYIQQNATTFRARVPDNDLIFGAPLLVDFENEVPRRRLALDCNSEGCLKLIQIASAVIESEHNR